MVHFVSIGIMRLTLHLPHWHFSPENIGSVEHSQEDAATLYLLLGLSIVMLSVGAIYLYSASL
ncbi:MAG: hypothetical protein AAB544_01545 [Patescibacteria group bacterium]